MAYKVYSLLCRNHDHGEMDYKGEGNFECPVCGFTYHDDDYDDDDFDYEAPASTIPGQKFNYKIIWRAEDNNFW